MTIYQTISKKATINLPNNPLFPRCRNVTFFFSWEKQEEWLLDEQIKLVWRVWKAQMLWKSECLFVLTRYLVVCVYIYMGTIGYFNNDHSHYSNKIVLIIYSVNLIQRPRTLVLDSVSNSDIHDSNPLSPN